MRAGRVRLLFSGGAAGSVKGRALAALRKRSFLQRIQQSRFLWIIALQKGIA
jgi:hypothetical protein